VEHGTVGDAYGATLARSYRTGARPGENFELIERDDGFISVTDAAGYFVPPAKWPRIDRWAYQRVSGRVLDIGCGAGRHADPLTKAEFDLVGIDISPLAVEVARQRGVAAHVADIIEPPAGLGTFDTLLLLGNNVGLLGGEQQTQIVLKQLGGLVRPGGQIIGVGMDPFLGAGPEHLAYHERNRQLGRPAGLARIRYRDRNLVTPWIDQIFLPLHELAEAIDATPWSVEETYTEGADYAVRLRFIGR